MARESKKILFLTQSHNALDHFLPLISGLIKTGRYNLEILYIPSKIEILTNRVHKKIISEYSLKQISLVELYSFKYIMKPLLHIRSWGKSQVGSKKVSYELTHKFRVDLLIYKAMILTIDNILESLKTFVLPSNNIKEYLTNSNYDMIVTDIQVIASGSIDNSLWDYTSYNILYWSKQFNVPIMMLSHGAVTYYSKSYESFSDDIGKIITPDIISLCFKKEKEIFSKIIGVNTKILYLGDIRHDFGWIKKLDTEVKAIYPVERPTGKCVILFIARSFHNTSDPAKARSEVYSDLSLLVREFQDTELWIKPHPRYPKAYDIEEADNIKVFSNETDTNFLITNSDIIITASSGVVFQLIAKQIKTIYITGWKKKYCPPDAWSPFDESDCVYQAINLDQLIIAVKILKTNRTLDFHLANRFYKEFVSGGVDIGSSIICNYVSLIDNYLCNK